MRRIGIVAGDHVISERPQAIRIVAGREKLERADPDMALGDAGEHGAGQRRFAEHRLPRRHHGERPRGRDAERVHALADEVFAHDRPQCGAAIGGAGKRGAAGALQLDVAA